MSIQHKYHYIYKTTCNVTNCFYIGMHSTSNFDDGYIGSGKRLWRSINKYGKENHSVEILEQYTNRESLKLREKELVNEDLLKDSQCMNLQLGGGGGFSSEEHKNKFIKSSGSRLGGQSAQKKLKWLRENDQNWCKRFHDKMSSAMSNNMSFLGKTHSDKTKSKMSKRAKTKIGDLNSQFGTCWIHNNLENKKIKNNEIQKYIDLNWIKGRKMKF